jgi:hypothetical protein
VVGAPLFIALTLLSGGFLGGLLATFDSSAWTLVYRELRLLEKGSNSPPHEALPAVGASGEA